MPHRMRLGQIDDAHQRVQRFDAQHRIVLGDGLQMMNFLFHGKIRFPQIYGFYRLCARPAGEIRNQGKRIRNPSPLRAGPVVHLHCAPARPEGEPGAMHATTTPAIPPAAPAAPALTRQPLREAPRNEQGRPGGIRATTARLPERTHRGADQNFRG